MADRGDADPTHWDALAAEYEATGHRFTTQYAEEALALAALEPGDRVLDIATGTGALALAAAHAAFSVVAIDFSPGMVRRVEAHALPGLQARQMNGQALDLPDVAFDAAFSIFGIFLFSDWRAGLSEMARVVRSGALGIMSWWQDRNGAGPNLLLSATVAKLQPDLAVSPLPGGTEELRHPARLISAMKSVGFGEVAITPVTRDYVLAPAMFDTPDQLFGFSPIWRSLTADQRDRVTGDIRE